jgi:CheY-like chemotaxis protein
VEVASRIKSSRPWLPVVIVTGYGSDENVARAKAAGVSTVLHKPLSPETIEGSALEATVEPALEAPVTTEAPVAAPAAPAPAQQTEAKPRGVLGFIKNVALFFAAPLIGLAYALAFPFVGLGLIAWHGGKAIARRSPAAARAGKTVGTFAVAPLVGLAYAIVLPFVGLTMLVWLCSKPLFARTNRQ